MSSIPVTKDLAALQKLVYSSMTGAYPSLGTNFPCLLNIYTRADPSMGTNFPCLLYIYTRADPSLRTNFPCLLNTNTVQELIPLWELTYLVYSIYIQYIQELMIPL